MECEFGPKCGVCNSDASAFTSAVYHTVARIPPGRVMTYGAVARAVGKPAAARAVGNAMNRNPHNRVDAMPRVPCHRVVGSNGMGGFARELSLKIDMLRGEGVIICKGAVVDGCHHNMGAAPKTM